MIECVSVATSHLFGDAIASQFRLRYRIFVDRRQWDVLSWEGMEFDQFDTPATTYFIWRDQKGEAKGVARIAPTELPYMLQAVWPEMVTKEPLSRNSCVWEGSRIGIERDLSTTMRRQVLGEIFCAYLEFGLRRKIDRFLILMPVSFLKRTVTRVGWPPDIIGPARKMNGVYHVAASMKVRLKILRNVRENMKIDGPVLITGEDILRHKAA